MRCNAESHNEEQLHLAKSPTISSAMMHPWLPAIWSPVTQSYMNLTPCNTITSLLTSQLNTRSLTMTMSLWHLLSIFSISMLLSWESLWNLNPRNVNTRAGYRQIFCTQYWTKLLIRYVPWYTIRHGPPKIPDNISDIIHDDKITRFYHFCIVSIPSS